MALTKKQIRFCGEYVIDYNGTKAAIRAGYKESNAASQASKLLQNPEVLACIKENQKRLVDSSCLTEEKVINHLQDVLERCLSAKPVTEWDYSEHEMVETGEWAFDSKGALEAIKMLGQHLGMFSNKIKISTDGDDTLKEMMEYFEQREKENI